VVSVIGAWLGSASTSNFISGMVLSIVQFIRPDYAIESWHKYLTYVAVILAACVINIIGARLLPAFNRFICKQKKRLSLTET
jgi:choline transport protein